MHVHMKISLLISSEVKWPLRTRLHAKLHALFLQGWENHPFSYNALYSLCSGCQWKILSWFSVLNMFIYHEW